MNRREVVAPTALTRPLSPRVRKNQIEAPGDIKFVIASKRDSEWMVDVVKGRSLNTRFQVLVSGVFGAVATGEFAEGLLNSSLNLRMQLQLHKYIWSPDKRGV